MKQKIPSRAVYGTTASNIAIWADEWQAAAALHLVPHQNHTMENAEALEHHLDASRHSSERVLMCDQGDLGVHPVELLQCRHANGLDREVQLEHKGCKAVDDECHVIFAVCQLCNGPAGSERQMSKSTSSTCFLSVLLPLREIKKIVGAFHIGGLVRRFLGDAEVASLVKVGNGPGRGLEHAQRPRQPRVGLSRE